MDVPSSLWILVATAVVAVVALIAAIVAVTAARRIARMQRTAASPASTSVSIDARSAADTAADAPALIVPTSARVTRWEGPREGASFHELEGTVVDGRVIVPVSSEQLAAAALLRPSVRATVVARSVARALRPESRDRIRALMRRSYRERRRARLRAGRHAVRTAHPQASSPSSQSWLGELPEAGS